MLNLIFHMVFSFLSSISFAIICNVPKKSIPMGGIVGMLGWMGYILLSTNGYGIFQASDPYLFFQKNYSLQEI